MKTVLNQKDDIKRYTHIVHARPQDGSKIQNINRQKKKMQPKYNN